MMERQRDKETSSSADSRLPTHGALLEGVGVSRRFGGLLAVSKVDFAVQQGEIFGLIGPNGAGKTTLMNLISGLTPPSSGRLDFQGRQLNGMPPHDIARMGIARTFQVMRPFQGLTARENVAIGARFGSSGDAGHMAAALAKADGVLDWIGLRSQAYRDVAGLTTGERKRLELARALAMDPKLLLLDEVMGGLNTREIGEVMDLIRRVNQRGVTVLLIEHLMKAVMGLCNRVLVLHHGARIALGTPDEVANDPAVIEAYLGQRYAAARIRESGVGGQG
jgi:branched-chain amino acid transport system ATP-binding protein